MEWFLKQDGAAGGGTSESDTRNTLPAFSATDTLTFLGDWNFGASQLNVGVINTLWRAHPDYPRSVWTSTATNFGSINISTASGVTEFDRIVFRNYLSGSTNGAVINCSVNGTSGIASSLRVRRSRVESCCYNAFRFNGTNQARSALLGEFFDVEWDDIGEDCIFGWAQTMTIARPRAHRISTRTTTGDFLGMINGYDADVHVYGPGVVDHSDVDCKQCFIVDASGGTPAGLLEIEGIRIIGYGSATEAPTQHTVIISDIPIKVHHCEIDAYGLLSGTNHSGDEFVDNVVNVGNMDANNVLLAMSANGGLVARNTIRGTSVLPAAAKMVVVANGVTNATVESNVFEDVPIAVKSNSVGYNPTTRNNSYAGVTSERLNSSSVAFSGTNEVTTTGRVREIDYMPTAADQLSAGYYVAGKTDLYGVARPNPPTIGAVQYCAAVAAASVPAFLYDNRLIDATPVASSTEDDFDVENLADLRPYSFWMPTALPATITVDCGEALPADFAAIYRHDLSSRNCAIEIRASTDNFSSSDVLITSRIPDSDEPLLVPFDSVSYRYWRITIEGSEMPTLAIALIGEALRLPRRQVLGFDPVARSARTMTNQSAGGYPLGKVTAFEEWRQKVALDVVQWDWLRDTWLPAWREHLRDEPFLYAWDSTDHPTELYLVTSSGEFAAPTLGGDKCSFEVEISGAVP